VGGAEPGDAVVKVLAVVLYPDPLQPWAKTRPLAVEQVAGTGVVIEGNRILTSAHLVLYAREVEVQARPGDEKFDAKVAAIAPDMDLAVLTVEDKKFFQNRPPLARARQLPKIQDAVEVYGFPLGGQQLAVAKGTVARFEHNPSTSGLDLLIQVNAPINPGGSGGPAVVDNKMVGLVLGRLLGAENVGYLIPNEEIDFFLKDIEDGRYDGKLREAAGTRFQRLENDALRSLLKLDPEVKGVLVLPPRHAEPNYPIQTFDVFTHIGPYALNNDGMVQLPEGLRVPFYSLFSKLATESMRGRAPAVVGTALASHNPLCPTVAGLMACVFGSHTPLAREKAVPVSLVRQGQRLTASLPLSTKSSTLLIPEYQGEEPSYFIHGPLVFSAARDEAIPVYLQLNPMLRLTQSSLLSRRFDRVQFPGEELVVVTAPMFKHRITRGYRDPVGQVVKEVNGIPIRNLRHLVEILRDCQDEYLTFCFAEDATEVLVFRRQEMDQATQDIMRRDGIPLERRGSSDLLEVWQKEAAPRR
jgi:S1-C subfamily serine protease